MIWVEGNETTIRLIPVCRPFPGPPHSVTPESFTLPPGDAGGYVRRTWFLSVAPSPSHFPLLWICLFKGCSSSGVSTSPQRTFPFSLGLGVPTAVFHSYPPSSTVYMVFSAFLKICFHRNATSLSCGLSCVLWWVYETLFSSQWAIFHKFLSMPENYFQK